MFLLSFETGSCRDARLSLELYLTEGSSAGPTCPAWAQKSLGAPLDSQGLTQDGKHWEGTGSIRKLSPQQEQISGLPWHHDLCIQCLD